MNELTSNCDVLLSAVVLNNDKRLADNGKYNQASHGQYGMSTSVWWTMILLLPLECTIVLRTVAIVRIRFV